MNDTNDALMTKKEAARLLGVSVRTIENHMKSRLPFSYVPGKTNRQVVFNRADVLALKVVYPQSQQNQPVTKTRRTRDELFTALETRIASLEREKKSQDENLYDAIEVVFRCIGMPEAEIEMWIKSLRDKHSRKRGCG